MAMNSQVQGPGPLTYAKSCQLLGGQASAALTLTVLPEQSIISAPYAAEKRFAKLAALALADQSAPELGRRHDLQAR